ncbi:MAG TPA: hypothetical protein PKY59_15525 [Pyrinomonadaceae bacterium]|nr:hypothetical protein [Pyrinomonadaceae bacterium]
MNEHEARYKTDELLEQASLHEKHSSISAAEKEFADSETAEKVFSTLKKMLHNIHDWNEHAMLTSFALFNENGVETTAEDFEIGGFMRISLKGAMKYDWVKIVDIYEAENEFVLKVKPSFDPTDETRDKDVTSHFFTDEAENNFCLVKKINNVGLYVIGLHEKMNSSETSNSLETIRNAAVNLGSYFGVQEGEWEKFCHHFLEDAEKRSGK